jgi:hypothetical protein
MTTHITGLRDAGSSGSALRVADWLPFAAAPTFAVMALLTLLPGSMPDPLCAAAHDASPLGGMTTMYLLMSAFHGAPWLKRLSRNTQE